MARFSTLNADNLHLICYPQFPPSFTVGEGQAPPLRLCFIFTARMFIKCGLHRVLLRAHTGVAKQLRAISKEKTKKASNELLIRCLLFCFISANSHQSTLLRTESPEDAWMVSVSPSISYVPEIRVSPWMVTVSSLPSSS